VSEPLQKMPIIVSASEAQRRFEELVAAAANGIDVLLARRGKPVARVIVSAPVSLDDSKDRAPLT
jgi:prevent-host-death family protein